MSLVIKKFVELEGGGKELERMLSSLWNDKITKLSVNELQTLEKTEGKDLVLYVYKGSIVAILHKRSGLFLLVYTVSALELETLRYIVEKSKNPDEDFISLVYEYLNKGNSRLGLNPQSHTPQSP
ncbi:MAG: hypothetical protein JZD40_02005 [Sulfolobus sp.]|nr:hypothetical protein [Sulfolobus sp.]